METPESEEFRRALENLGASAERARRIMEQLRQALDELAFEAYQDHGCPFGEGPKALDVWLEYEVYTTAS